MRHLPLLELSMIQTTVFSVSASSILAGIRSN